MGLIDRLRRRYEASRLHQLRLLLQDSDAIRGNVKNFGYQLARDAVERRGEVDVSAEPQRRGLVSKPTTQADMESAWFAYWCSQVKAAPIYHRKLWEFAFALQVLHDQGLLREGARGIGFGCGEEPLASYFASQSMDVLVTDLDSTQVAGQGWTETGQHAGTLESAFFPDIVDRARFARHVTHRFVDMNAIPRFDAPFDCASSRTRCRCSSPAGWPSTPPSSTSTARIEPSPKDRQSCTCAVTSRIWRRGSRRRAAGCLGRISPSAPGRSTASWTFRLTPSGKAAGST
jgi:hypothetical protein